MRKLTTIGTLFLAMALMGQTCDPFPDSGGGDPDPDPVVSCDDGIQNGLEEGVDCGADACGVRCGSFEVLEVGLCQGPCELTADAATAVGSVGRPGRAVRWNRTAGVTELGNLPGGNSGSRATAVSADGGVVVGWSHSGTREAFRWTEAGAMLGLGVLPGYDDSVAYDVSADGSVVVGAVISDQGEDIGFVWTETDRMVSLPELTSAVAISDDGSVIAGNFGQEAYLRTEAEGLVYLGAFTVKAISADGAAVAGYDSNGDAVRWIRGQGVIGLGAFSPEAISDDGRVVVGTGSSGGNEAIMWTEQDGALRLGGFPNASSANDVSPDGRLVLGHSWSGAASDGQTFLWQPAD